MNAKHQTRMIALGAGLCIGSAAIAPTLYAQVDTPVAGAIASSELTGEVTVVNPKTRLMTIKTPAGVYEVLNVPESIEGIDEIDIGDEVTITATEAVLVGVEKGPLGGTPAAVATRTVQPVAGEDRAASVVDDITAYGTVEEVNKAASTVTVRGTEGPLLLKVRDPMLLTDLSAGDVITAHYRRVVTGEIKD